MLWDTHMHTHFSVDSEAKPLEMIQSSIRAGVDGICFTEHLDLEDKDYTLETYPLDIPAYFKEMQEFQTQFGDTFPIYIGVEIGLQTYLKDTLPEIVKQHPFDFVIGSSHWVNGEDPYYPEYFYGKVEDEAYLEYFESILENLAVFDCFDVYGHFDNEKIADVLDEILRVLIQKGKGIEINTGGFKYGLGHPNPTEAVLKRYRELGGEIITIGADAHKPQHVAFDFQKVPQILKDAGFDYYTVFSGRKPVFYKL